MRVPRAAVLYAIASVSTLSVDAFHGAIVDDAISKHATGPNETLEWEEFMSYARGSLFPLAWFGELGKDAGAVSWKDAHLTLKVVSWIMYSHLDHVI